MEISKVQPVYNTLDYWHKWRPFAHSLMSKHSKDIELHTSLDDDLFILLKRLLPNLDTTKNILAYIKKSIKGLVMVLLRRKDFKYAASQFESRLEDYPIEKCGKVDFTLDDYLISNSLLKYINKLPVNERDVIKRYYGLDSYKELNSIEIAKIYNLSSARIRAIRDRGIKRLRSWLLARNLKMEDFLND